MKKHILILSLFLVLRTYASGIEIKKLTCDLQINPLGIHHSNPVFGWVLTSKVQADKQTAYQILIAGSSEKLAKDEGDVWNSGKVESGKSQYITYRGIPLKNGQRYYWKVKVWDASGTASTWSDTNHFDMGIDPMDWKGEWIGAIRKADAHLPEGHHYVKYGLPKQIAKKWDSVAPLAKQSIILRKEFPVKSKIKRAVVYVCGLGNYELSLNGNKIGNDVMAPLWSDYDKTVYYNVFDLTGELRKGVNAFGVMLGNGMYNVTGNRYIKFWGSYGPSTLRLQLNIEYMDGTTSEVVTDKTWKYAMSPVTFNCMYGGEDYDATLEQPGWDKPGFKDSKWMPVVIQEGPNGKLIAQNAPPVKIMTPYPVFKSFHPNDSLYVFDMGQNLSGFPAIKVKGKKGQTIKIWVGEQLKRDSTVSQSQTGGPYYMVYTLKGDGIEEWHPRFTYYGFKYIQIKGVSYEKEEPGKAQLLDLKSCFVYSSAENTGSFESSNEIFNKAHQIINNAVKSNMQAVFTDCPHREKLGWLEETHLVLPGIMFNYNVSTLLDKTQQDMEDAQHPDGLVPDIAPEYTGFSGGFLDSPEWGSTAIITPWMYYQFYGDSSLIVRSYPMMKKYLQYLSTKADSFILSHGLGDWYDYGNKPAGPSQNTPIALTATAYYYYDAVLLQKSANLLGLKEDETYFAALANHIKEAFNRKFFNATTNQYGTGSQVSNAMAIYMNLVAPENKAAVLNNLIKDIRERGNRLTSGDIGNRYLFQTLATNDRNDVMFDMNNHEEVPGYGFQIKMGVTTLTENWDPRKGNSWNHLMMGHIEEWLFRSLAGINPDQPGFKHFIVRPAMNLDLKYVKASYHSLYGEIKSSWTKEGNNASLTISIPVNTTSTVYFPSDNLSNITVNGKPVNDSGIKVISSEKGEIVFEVPSGIYTFKK